MIGGQTAVVLYVLALVAVVVGVDILFFRNQFRERLIVNVGIVLMFAAFYYPAGKVVARAVVAQDALTPPLRSVRRDTGFPAAGRPARTRSSARSRPSRTTPRRRGRPAAAARTERSSRGPGRSRTGPPERPDQEAGKPGGGTSDPGNHDGAGHGWFLNRALRTDPRCCRPDLDQAGRLDLVVEEGEDGDIVQAIFL